MLSLPAAGLGPVPTIPLGASVKRFFIAIVILVLLFGGIFGWKYLQMQKMAAQMSQPRPPSTVAAVKVQAEQWQPKLTAVGSLKAVDGIGVTTEVAGVVSEILFESGERASRGKVLVRLDASVDRASLQTLRAAARLAQVQFKRSAELLPKKAVSRSTYDETKASYDAAKAEVTRQEAVLDKKTIRAPFDGLLGIRQVDMGQFIEPGDVIVNLQSLDPIYLDYSLPERYLSQLEQGQQVEVRLDALPDEVFIGTIGAIEPAIDEKTRNVRVRAVLENPTERLRPGMFAQVATLEGGPRDVLTVPRTAVSFNTYGDFVYVLEENDEGQLTATRRQVKLGESREGRVEVVEGLQPDQQVVRTGLVKLRDQQPVQLDQSVTLNDSEISGE